jgi:hypothetical protein
MIRQAVRLFCCLLLAVVCFCGGGSSQVALAGWSFSAWSPEPVELQPANDPITPASFAYTKQDWLNSHREQIGEAAFKIVHPNGSYERTDAISVAPRDGGGWVFRFPIHWKRKLGLVVRQHITQVDWEVLDRQHVRVHISHDDSTFPPINLDQLNEYFRSSMASEW